MNIDVSDVLSEHTPLQYVYLYIYIYIYIYIYNYISEHQYSMEVVVQEDLSVLILQSI